ncbi:hypothetical protein, partial [Vibrio vulnificus]|uniref:hypothetical protein n=1 Tax=Vibrio vulnificus TaxID=672 RepID=UPI0039B5829F
GPSIAAIVPATVSGSRPAETAKKDGRHPFFPLLLPHFAGKLCRGKTSPRRKPAPAKDLLPARQG